MREGVCFWRTPLLYGKGKAPCIQTKTALQGQKYTDLRRCSAEESQKDEHQSSGRSRWTLM